MVSTFRIRFTVVSEPPDDGGDDDDDDEGECEDIGIAFVSVRDILINKHDVTDQDIPSKSLNVLMSKLWLLYNYTLQLIFLFSILGHDIIIRNKFQDIIKLSLWEMLFTAETYITLGRLNDLIVQILMLFRIPPIYTIQTIIKPAMFFFSNSK